MPKAIPPDDVPGEVVDGPIEPVVDAAPAEEHAEPGPQWGRWRYSGPAGRCYTSTPVTPEPGDVVECWGPPAADGFWEATDAEPTRMPDNWRPDPTDEEHAKLRGDDTN